MSRRIIPVKVILAGDGAVGKTTLRKRYMGDKQTSSYIATIGADFAKKVNTITLGEEELTVESLIWDLAGQASFTQIRSTFYEGARGAILVFDITRRETFDTAQKWISEIFENNSLGPIPIIFLANKQDLRGKSDQALDKEETEQMIGEIRKWAKNLADFDYKFLETSALTGHHVDEAFKEILLEIFNKSKKKGRLNL